MVVAIFLSYFLLILVTGIISYRKTRDFSLGGRKLPFFVIALSEKASDFSAWLLLGLPGLAYVDPVAALCAGGGCMMGTIFNWIFIAEKLRIESFKNSSNTLPEFFAKKFGGDERIVKNIAVFVVSLFFLFMFLPRLWAWERF